MKGGAPRVVGELLVSAMPQLEDRLLVQRLHRAWGALLGPEIARRCRPTALVNGTLQVTVDNSPWLHELTLRAPDLAAQMTARFPAVRSLRFTLGPPPVAEEPQPVARPARPRSPLTDDDRRAIDAAAAAIPDPDVAAGARRLLARAWPATPARGIER